MLGRRYGGSGPAPSTCVVYPILYTYMYACMFTVPTQFRPFGPHASFSTPNKRLVLPFTFQGTRLLRLPQTWIGRDISFYNRHTNADMSVLDRKGEGETRISKGLTGRMDVPCAQQPFGTFVRRAAFSFFVLSCRRPLTLCTAGFYPRLSGRFT